MAGLDKLRYFDGFVFRIVRAMRELHDGRGGHAERFEIVLDQVGGARVLAEHAPAGHDLGSDACAVQPRSVKRTIARVIVIAEDDQGVGRRGRLVHYPKLPGETHQRMPRDIDERPKHEEKKKKEQTKENSAALRGLSLFV